MWNERYSGDEYIFGTEPNEYFKNEITRLKPGRILLVGEGEGRNAVYAAKCGWIVDAYDFSESARDKAFKLAKENNVTINYFVKDLTELSIPTGYYDAAAAIYIHIEEDLRISIHKKIYDSLKNNGTFIFEAYDKKQMNYSTGGPKNIDLLYSLDELTNDFIDYDFINFSNEIIFLNEGKKYIGDASVIRFTGVKNEKLD